MSEILMYCPKIFIISLSKSIFTLAIFISFLFNNEINSLSITSVTSMVLLWPIFAGIVTDFSELNDFPSPNLKTVWLSFCITFDLSSFGNDSK